LLVDGENADAVVSYDGGETKVDVAGASPAADANVFDGKDEVFALRRGRQTRVRVRNVSIAATQGGAGDGVIKAPMHGKVLELFVSTGETVAAGQRLAVIEAMKMEHTLRAPFAGSVAELAVDAGQQVVEGAQIVVIERADAG
jgi:3-methylcrotonyl-CoA carboxylase alpha subunit